MSKVCKLRRFNPDMIPDYASLLFAGPRRSGKSFCARDIAYHLRNRVYDATVFTGTMEENHPWTQFVPQQYVYKGFDEEVLGRVLNRQEERVNIVAKYNGLVQDETKTVAHAGHMIVWEDLEYVKPNVFTSESATEVMLNGRHWKTYPMVLIQYIMKGITRENRGMFDYAFFTKETDAGVRKKIWQCFGGVCKTFEEFDTIFRVCTENHRVLVVKCGSDSYDPREQFYYYKAKDYGVFHIGSKDFWEVASKQASGQDLGVNKPPVKVFAPKTNSIYELDDTD